MAMQTSSLCIENHCEDLCNDPSAEILTSLPALQHSMLTLTASVMCDMTGELVNSM